MGLPGDLSSQSRFVRVAFVKMNSLSGDSEEESVSQFFHILGSVDQQRGAAASWEKTSMRLRYILPAVIQIRESTIIQLTKTTRSVLLICTRRTWKVRSFIPMRP